jgi:hypothetical protein
MLKVGGHEISIIERESAVNVAFSMCRMRQQVESPSVLKGSDEAIQGARGNRPEESGKSSLTPSKAPLIGKEGIEHLNRS